MVKRLMQGAAAGAAGATALNAATCLDMVLRARPSSSTPKQVAEKLSQRAGVEIPGEAEEHQNRLQGLDALSGLATGVVIGALAGELRFAVLRLGPVLGAILLGGAAMAATDGGDAFIAALVAALARGAGAADAGRQAVAAAGRTVAHLGGRPHLRSRGQDTGP